MTALVILLVVVLAALAVLLQRFGKLQADHKGLSREHEAIKARFQGVVDADAERQRVLNEVGHIRAQHEQALQQTQRQHATAATDLQGLQMQVNRVRAELSALDEEAHLQSFGFYKPRYNFSSSERYQTKLEEIRERQKQMIKDKKAATCAIEWTVNGSVAEGKKQINQTLKLMLRAFNGECDAAVAKVKYNNIHVMEARIQKAREAINGLAEIQQCTITATYLKLKLDELYLVHEYEEKVQEEKEEQRRIREQMREEEQALREIEKARQDAEKEEKRYADALRKAQEDAARADGNKQQKLLAQIAELEKKLAEAHTNKERALSRAQQTRSGHVYIISNIGSFGEQVYKIGMTRRLDPMDRVKELGDASVPFEFDVHAIIYTEDAPALENTLHRAFNHRRVNRVNEKKEFFKVRIEEIVELVRNHHKAEVEIVMTAEAEEYRKTLAMVEQEQQPQPTYALA
ncbi:DUF4041 domain-containing protein [Polyangium jinanense]|uniref:DUF4041 domain-containing protein n=1 Tax=Polyangium jinanense TaxID=2829994 RepID=A0A9X3X8I8_9BACT|nr:DUF4041 domain-containing protein [Polyangium jinanense]MDC3985929.1 DUF4041 domain-containing protein [Polyangium jinanense]